MKTLLSVASTITLLYFINQAVESNFLILEKPCSIFHEVEKRDIFYNARKRCYYSVSQDDNDTATDSITAQSTTTGTNTAQITTRTTTEAIKEKPKYKSESWCKRKKDGNYMQFQVSTRKNGRDLNVVTDYKCAKGKIVFLFVHLDNYTIKFDDGDTNPRTEANYCTRKAKGFCDVEKGESNSWSFYWRSYFPRVMMIRMSYGMVFHIINISIVWGDIFRMTEFFMIFVLHQTVFVKCATMYFHRGKLEKVMDTMDHLHDLVVTSFPDDVMRTRLHNTERNAYRYGRMYITTMTSLMAVNAVMLMYLGFMTRALPLKLWFPYDAQSSPMFELTLAIAYPIVIIDAFVVGVCDVLFVTLSVLIASQFTVLQKMLIDVKKLVDESLDGEDDQEGDGRGVDHVLLQCMSPVTPLEMSLSISVEKEQEDSNQGSDIEDDASCVLSSAGERIPDNMMRQEQMLDPECRVQLVQKKIDHQMEVYLGQCVTRHQTLLWLTEELNCVFKVMLGHQVLDMVLAASAALCITTLAPQLDMKVLVYICVLFACYLQFLLYCLCGSHIEEESEKIQYAVYACDWLGASEGFKRSMRIIISRTNKSVIIKAAGLPLSVRSFRLMCKIGYYFHMVLSKLIRGENLLDID